MQWASPDMANKAKARLRDPALSRNLAFAYFKMSVVNWVKNLSIILRIIFSRKGNWRAL